MLTFGGPRETCVPARKPPGGEATINLSHGRSPRNSKEKDGAGQQTSRSNSNMRMDRPSTRVHAPPGGASSLTLAWEDACKRAPSPKNSKSGFHSARESRSAGRRQFQDEAPSVSVSRDDTYVTHSSYTRTPTSSSRKGSSLTNASRSVRSARAPSGATSAMSQAFIGATDRSACTPLGRVHPGGSLTAPTGGTSYASERNSTFTPTPRRGGSLAAPAGGASYATDRSSTFTPMPRSSKKGASVSAASGSFNEAWNVAPRRTESSSPRASTNRRPGDTRRTGAESARSGGQGFSGSRTQTDLSYFEDDYYSGSPRKCSVPNGSGTVSRTTGASWTPNEDREIQGWAGEVAKRCVGKQRSNETSTVASSSRMYDEQFGSGNFAAPVEQKLQRSATAPRMRPKEFAREEVEGSRPHVWKPSRAPKAPPGGHQTYEAAKYGDFDQAIEFSGAAGGNRECHMGRRAVHFHREEEESQSKPDRANKKPAADKRAQDTHRYYLAADDRPELVPGKARGPAKTNRHSILGLNDVPSVSERFSEPASSVLYDDAVSDADSMPLGAEWSTYCR